MEENIKYSVVIPVYNSEKSLCELYYRIKNIFINVIKENFEIIFVDDSSKDNSFKIIKELIEKDSDHVKAIQLAKNYGQHNALLCGFKYVSGEYVITLDDDLQHPPEEITKLIERMESNLEEIDVVIGCYASKKHSLVRNIGSQLIIRISEYIFKTKKDLKLTSFRLIKRFVVEVMVNDIKVSYPRIGYLILEVSNKIENVTVEHLERKYGKSGYSFSKLVRTFFNNIINNSILPLILVRNIGIGSFAISIVLGVYYLVRYFSVGISIQGWTTIILLILLFSGLILFAIGIIGVYLMQILNEAKKLPNYVIRKKEL